MGEHWSLQQQQQQQPHAWPGTCDKAMMGTLKECAGTGIATHAMQLKEEWCCWGKELVPADVPGGDLVLRECLLVCFLHATSILAEWCSAEICREWLLSLLQEGLTLGIVLFGPQHRLARKVATAWQRVAATRTAPRTKSSSGLPRQQSVGGCSGNAMLGVHGAKGRSHSRSRRIRLASGWQMPMMVSAHGPPSTQQKGAADDVLHDGHGVIRCPNSKTLQANSRSRPVSPQFQNVNSENTGCNTGNQMDHQM